MHPTIAKLLQEKPVVTDGAWGTMLQGLGLPVGTNPDGWNLTEPAKVQQVAAAYVAAGSRIILTNTFGANRLRLAESGLADQAVAINRRGVELSKAAAGTKALVFASVGPSGKMLLTGDVTEEQLYAAFAEQAAAIAAAGADGIVIETMEDLAEITQAVKAAKTTGLPVVACLTFSTGKNKDRTMMGVTPERAAELLAVGADVIGANCGQGIESFVPICTRLAQAAGGPVWMKPNAGLPQMQGGRTVYVGTPADFARQVPALIAAGAAFIGGCCGSTPDYIRATRTVLAGAAKA